MLHFFSIAVNATERETRDLINELQIMVTVGEHPNVISLIGACTKSGEQSQQIISTLKTSPSRWLIVAI